MFIVRLAGRRAVLLAVAGDGFNGVLFCDVSFLTRCLEWDLRLY